MQELRVFLGRVVVAKRQLKEVFYTTSEPDVKADVKQLVAAVIAVQRTLDELIELQRKSRLASKMLKDRKVELVLRKWSVGLPRRVTDYVDKKKKLKQEYLHRYQEVLLAYVEEIGRELSGWLIDIQSIRELPKTPRE
ncbi:MAG: hypothetical protein HXY34_03390 [Candidatus Thorarchaeota archaeon]|nr:hypothetical protein [Candidatus Thorarchaeota archaeon]